MDFSLNSDQQILRDTVRQFMETEMRPVLRAYEREEKLTAGWKMKTLLNAGDRNKVLERLDKLTPSSQRQWGSMSARQMVCHLTDSFRASLGEKQLSPSTNAFKRTIYKWVALWGPFHWPHGVRTRPEMDQQQGGTPPQDFASDVMKLRVFFGRFCSFEGEFAAHPTLGPLSRKERMRHAYLHMDHHLRQFGT